MLGPGARRGANILAGRWRSQGLGSGEFVDDVLSFDDSQTACNTLRRLINKEMQRIRSLPDIDPLALQLLWDAGESLAQSSDYDCQTSLCDVSKIMNFVWRGGYCRSPSDS